MHNEELIEDGIVKESKNGIATIVISNFDHCEECTAKLYCKPGSALERSLTVKDPFGVNPGDKVRVSVNGSKILSVTFLLYGIPLILLLAGIFIGLQIFSSNAEFFAMLFSLGLISIYVAASFIYSKMKKNKSSSYPEIIFVYSHQ